VADKNNYFFKICDMYNSSESILTEFHKLPFKNKVSFGINNFPSLKNNNHITVKESYKNQNKHVPNGVKLYKLSFLYFNIHKWLMN
jgi:uncharacterized protein (DUF1919 family)